MVATNAIVSPSASTNCAACGLGLKDATDARTGLDQSCRAQFDYRRISALTDEARKEAATLIHTLALDNVKADQIRGMLFRLYELGFEKLAQRIERRVGSRITVVEQVKNEMTVLVPPMEAAPAPPPVIELPFKLTTDQERAREVVNRLSKRESAVAVVAGFAGTGKTSMMRVFALEHGTPLVVAPTGKAALRVTEATGLQASTIHRWMYKPVEDPNTGAMKFVRKTWDDIEATIPRSRLVLLDEASMVSSEVWNDVHQVVQQHDLRLVCVGDSFQLPPVQPDNLPPFSILLPDFAQQLGAERVEMTEVLRQAQDSPIIRASMGLRQRLGRAALRDLKEIPLNDVGSVCTAVHRTGGITICHRNITRFNLNAAIRQALGINTEMPQAGEPLMVLRNSYETGVVNGETITFPGWKVDPNEWSRVVDRYKGTEENARFGGITLNDKVNATLALEELHGRLQSGTRGVADAAQKWARLENFYSGDSLAKHIHAHFGYAYTAHKSQGSQWPYVFVVLEPSIRLETEEGARWAYTAVTRAIKACAVFFGRIWS